MEIHIYTVNTDGVLTASFFPLRNRGAPRDLYLRDNMGEARY
jgi:hypothetical protein